MDRRPMKMRRLPARQCLCMSAGSSKGGIMVEGVGAVREGACSPSKRGAPPLGFPPPNPRRMGPRGGAQPSRGWFPSPLRPMRPSKRGGPSRWTPGTSPVAPVQYRYAPETFRCPHDNFPYIKLHLQTIPELLVTSGISSGTPNNIR